MKANILKLTAIAAIFAAIFCLNACQKESNEALNPTSSTMGDNGAAAPSSPSTVESRSNNNSAVFPPNAHMYGKSYGEWSKDWWIWALSYPCATNPILDQTGAYANQGQSGPVFFLGGYTSGPVTRNITIPHGKAVLFPILNFINDYPCPGGSDPAPGQSLEDFLTEGANGFFDLQADLAVTLDGVAISDVGDYGAMSDFFYFTGVGELADCFDACVTGELQPAVCAGYWIMLKPLSHGQHTLNFQGGIPAFPWSLEVTVNITVP